MLLYSMLHLAGVKEADAEHGRAGKLSVTLDDIKRFRQLDSKCPGHPEYHRDYGRRSDDRALRSRLRDECRHGNRRALAGEALQ